MLSSLLLALLLAPNIMVINFDDLGRADFPHSSYCSTPNIDAIADAGMSFSHHRADCVCTFSRYELLCGRESGHTSMPGVLTQASTLGLPSWEMTIAEVLHQQNYYNGIGGKWHLGKAQLAYYPSHHGFDESGWLPFSIDEPPLQWMVGDTLQDNPTKAQLTGRVTDFALGFLTHVPSGRNWFLYLAYPSTHYPYGFVSKLPGESAFQAAVRETDASVGQVVAAVLALDPSALILFTSDNGSPQAGHNGEFRGGKFTDYEGGLTTPAILYGLGTGVVTDNVWIGDWFATIASWAGATVPTDRAIEARDIFAYLQDREFWWSGAYLKNGDKIVKDGAWGLFNIWTDPNETTPITDPVKNAALVARWAAIKPAKGLLNPVKK